VAGDDKLDRVLFRPETCSSLYASLKSWLAATSESLKKEQPGNTMVPADCFSCRAAKAGATKAELRTRAAEQDASLGPFSNLMSAQTKDVSATDKNWHAVMAVALLG